MIEITRVNLPIAHYLDPHLDWLPQNFLSEVVKANSPVYLFERLPALNKTEKSSSRRICLLVSLRFRPTFISAIDKTEFASVYFKTRIIDCLRAMVYSSYRLITLDDQIYSWLSGDNTECISLDDFSIQNWQRQAAIPDSDTNALALNHSMLALATSGDISGTSEGIVFSPAQINVAESDSQVLMVAGLHGSGKTTLAEHRFATTLAQSRGFSAVFCSPRHQSMSALQKDRFQEVLNRLGTTRELNPEFLFFAKDGVSAYWLLAQAIYTKTCDIFSRYIDESLPYANITSLDSLCSLALETVEIMAKKEPLFCLFELIVIDDATDIPHCLIDLCKAVSRQTILFVNPLLEKTPAWPPCGYPGMSYVILDHSYTLSASTLQVTLVQTALRRWNKLGVLDTPPPLDFFGLRIQLPSHKQVRGFDRSAVNPPSDLRGLNSRPLVSLTTWIPTHRQVQVIYSDLLEGRDSSDPSRPRFVRETLIVLLDDVSENYSLSSSCVPDTLFDFYRVDLGYYQETDQAHVCGSLQARLLQYTYKRIFLLSTTLLEAQGWEKTFLYVASNVSDSIYVVAPDLGLL